MLLSWVRSLTVFLAVAALGGCAPVEVPRGQSPLKPATMRPESVALDIFFVRFPLGDPEVNRSLWEEIDEQHLAPETRRRLLENGFRAGVLAGPLPAKLAELLELADKPVPTGEPTEASSATLVEAPTVQRRHLQLRAGTRGEIIAADVCDELPVLVREPSGKVGGQSYEQAQPLLAITVALEPDGRVRLEWMPELHYGPIHQRRITSDGQGVLRFEPGRDRRVFHDMAAEAVLTSGDMLVLSTLPDRSGSLGSHFFTQCRRGVEDQKLLVIRLSQTQHDDQFAATAAR